jgi:hypothetical protein
MTSSARFMHACILQLLAFYNSSDSDSIFARASLLAPALGLEELQPPVRLTEPSQSECDCGGRD